ncbi:MAG: CHAT domain-containing protein [Catenulispora sp.]
MNEPTDHRSRVREAAHLLREHERTGSVLDLREAVVLLRSAVDVLREPGEERSRYLTNLCIATRRLFEETGDLGLLREAVAAGRESMVLTAEGHDWYGRKLANFGDALVRLYERSRDLGALAEADEVLVRAARGSTGRIRGIILGNVTVVKRHLGVEYEDKDQLRAAIAAGQEGIALLESGSGSGAASAAGVWSNVGMAYRALFQMTGDISVLRDAVDSSRTALGLLAGADPIRPGREHNLGIALRHLYEETGDLAVLGQAIEAHRAAIVGKPADGPFEAMCATALSSALYRRFQAFGDSGDLNETIVIARRAVGSTPPNHRRLALRLVVLGTALLARHVRGRRPGDLAEASAQARDAVRVAHATHPDHADALALLTNTLHRAAVATRDASLLDDAVFQARRAVLVTPDDFADAGAHLMNLGTTLLAKHELTGDSELLREAVSVIRQARLRTPGSHSRRPNRLLTMGTALGRAALSDHDDLAGSEAHAAFGEASAPTAPPAIRVRACQADARLAAVSGEWKSATRRYGEAIELLPQTAPRHLARIDREYQLSEVAGLVGEAAGAALHAGSPRRAAVLFEHGRGVILNEDVGARGSLAALRKVDGPLADEFVRIRSLLNVSETDSVDLPGAAARRGKLAEQWRAIVADIQALPPMRDFLSPLTYRALKAQAQAGPLIFLNAGPFRSDALVVTADGGPLVVPLPGATPSAVQLAVTRFLEAVDAEPPDQDVMLEILAWSWDAIAEPVLAALGITGSAERKPRVWWCPAGILSLLPLHAAGRHGGPGRATVMDRVVSSSLPTVRALAHARRPRAPRSDPDQGAETAASVAVPGRCLVVAMPQTRDAVDALGVPGAEREARVIEHRFPGRTSVLAGPAATFEAVARELPNAAWAHFACHAIGHPDDPSAGRLVLHDHADRPMTVADIARLDLDRAELAFLSACSTARPGIRLVDEAIHLASAFHLIGYRHVIGTLWPINDGIAVRFAGDVYDRLSKAPDTPVARAVHRATMRLRDRVPDHPSAWAAHVHSGA